MYPLPSRSYMEKAHLSFCSSLPRDVTDRAHRNSRKSMVPSALASNVRNTCSANCDQNQKNSINLEKYQAREAEAEAERQNWVIFYIFQHPISSIIDWNAGRCSITKSVTTRCGNFGLRPPAVAAPRAEPRRAGPGRRLCSRHLATTATTAGGGGRRAQTGRHQDVHRKICRIHQV